MQTPAISQDKFPQNQHVQPATLGTLLEGAGLAESATDGLPGGLRAMPSVSGQTTTIEAAIRAICSRNWAVVRSEDKVPARKLEWGGGKNPQVELQNRTQKTDRALEWLKNNPDMCLGLSVGQFCQSPDGLYLLVLDFDDMPSWEAFQELCASHDFDVALTYSERTPRGVHTFFYASPDLNAWNNNKIELTEGCHPDIKWAGGFVVVAPSVRSDGGRYEVLHDCRPADLPSWLATMINDFFATKDKAVQHEQGQRDQRQGNLQLDLSSVKSYGQGPDYDHRVRAWALSILDRRCRELAAMPVDSGRNNYLNASSLRLGQLAGLDRQEIEKELFAACHKNGLMATEPKQTKATIKQTLDKARAMPRVYPPDTTDRPQASTGIPASGNGQQGQAQTGTDAELEELPPTPYATIDFEKISGEYYAYEPLPEIKTIFAGMIPGTLGGVVAAPGTGKSTALVQSVAMAGGAAWLGTWEPCEPLRVLCVFAEDPAQIVHRRVQLAIQALPAWARVEAVKNYFAVPLRGDVALITDEFGIVRTTRAWDDFRRLVDKINPDLIFLDTYSRVVSLTNENNNTAITRSMSLFDQYCYDTGRTLTLTTHTDKLHSRVAEAKTNLIHVLSQTATRGGTGFAASVRWLLTMVPMSAAFAGEIISDEAGQMADSTFIAAKVTKTNYGPQGGIFYFQHGENGLLQPVKPEKDTKKQATLQDRAHMLVEIVRQRQEEGLAPLSFSQGIAKMEQYPDPDTGTAWGMSKYESARQYAVDQGLLKSAKKEKGNGQILVLGDCDFV